MQLFNQLAPVHGLAPEQRVPLELAALLHDAGRAVHTRAHHKHGEYLVRHADIPGLGRHQQHVVACLVRYHGKSTPEPHHRLYRSLAPAERLRVRQLAALLRIAVALDADNTQAVRRVETKIQRDDGLPARDDRCAGASRTPRVAAQGAAISKKSLASACDSDRTRRRRAAEAERSGAPLPRPPSGKPARPWPRVRRREARQHATRKSIEGYIVR